MANALSSQLRISVEDKQGLSIVFPQARLALFDRDSWKSGEERELKNGSSIHDPTRREAPDGEGAEGYYLNEQIKAIHKELGRKDERAELDS